MPTQALTQRNGNSAAIQKSAEMQKELVAQLEREHSQVSRRPVCMGGRWGPGLKGFGWVDTYHPSKPPGVICTLKVMFGTC
jgi:hypothetical protein